MDIQFLDVMSTGGEVNITPPLHGKSFCNLGTSLDNRTTTSGREFGHGSSITKVCLTASCIKGANCVRATEYQCTGIYFQPAIKGVRAAECQCTCAGFSHLAISTYGSAYFQRVSRICCFYRSGAIDCYFSANDVICSGSNETSIVCFKIGVSNTFDFSIPLHHEIS